VDVESATLGIHACFLHNLCELYITEAGAKRGACCTSEVFDARKRFIWNQDVMTSIDFCCLGVGGDVM
jgi:hypothetical protein